MKTVGRVAIVGRPNVGKSTLFNRIIGKRKALVHPQPGVTRDVQSCLAEWNGVSFEIIDTGGLFAGIDDDLLRAVEDRALKEALGADEILLVTDAQAGLTPADTDVADRLRRAGLPVFLVVNKMDKRGTKFAASDFAALGFDNMYEISALQGEGIGDLLDDVVALLPRRALRERDGALKIAVAGRPNVGKSSLVNALVGKETNIVDSRPGTTRDSIDISVRWYGHEITLVDTAGIKRRSKTRDGLTALTALKSIDSIARADVVVMMLDASLDVSNQDVKVASYAHKAGKGIMLCVNKWDLVDKSSRTAADFERKIRRALRYLAYAPIIFISALTGQRVSRVFELAWRIKEEREKRLATSEVNQYFAEITERQPPPFHGGGTGKIYYATQVEVAPPTFAVFVNKRHFFPRSYLRYLNNQIRDKYAYEGTVIRIKLVERTRD